ncbi:hypothetical protein [Pseudorhodobacter sp. MZDSW-24AT]|uniref:hypothetical protein n=1 Tax=Pseudorhodobacter sp. MZDSW-24AT TaxID=2052957 RepID=UPI000C1E1C7C|nr:hypothetical protein [Pseudorhodobacter sp. MZDSW-24AT]PJF11204.1 hypothetical protein CUR21_00925 [Pseudorhodobacter sp. MZDSW-24AT]
MGLSAGLGHNGGPELAGLSWRGHCWRTARARLLPNLPLEVVRLRVRRAAELGLDYKTYAGIRASTGHDLVAFLFSSNALRILRQGQALPADRAVKLGAIQSTRLIGLAVPPLAAQTLAEAAPILAQTHSAPPLLGSFNQARDQLRAVLGKTPSDTVLLIGDHGLEAEWCAAGRLAGYLPAARYFGA